MNKVLTLFIEKINELKKLDKTNSVILVSSFILLIVIIIMVVALLRSPKEEEIATSYIMPHPIEIPKEPGYSLDYVYSREVQDSWPREDVVEWFTIPEGEELDRLESENEQLVTDILEAAP